MSKFVEENVFLQALCGPDAKASGHAAFDPIPHGNNHIEIVEIDHPGDVSFTLSLNYPIFSDSCLLGQLAFVVMLCIWWFTVRTSFFVVNVSTCLLLPGG